MGFRRTAIYYDGTYTIEAFGYGAAYLVTEGRQNVTLWVQGDDAATLHTELNEADKAGVAWSRVLDDYLLADAFTPAA